jgi:hypothetical protein
MAEFAAHTSETIEGLDADAVPSDADFVIEQQVTSDDHLVDHFHVKLVHGTAVVIDGPAVDPDLTIRQDVETARALRAGEIHAQRAFLTGQLEIDGDIDKLLDHGPLLTTLLRGRGA